MRATLCVLGLVLGGAASAGAQVFSVAARNGVNYGASATDQNGQAFTVTGVSGIVWMGGTSYATIMDNSNKVVFMNITLAADGSITGATITGALTVAESRDFEDIVVDAGRGVVMLSEEGTPRVREYRLSDGAVAGSLPVPAVFLTRRDNYGLESLSRRQGGTELWTASEEALAADGPLSTPTTGTVLRMLKYAASGASYVPAAEYAWQTQPIHGAVTTRARSGVSQVLVLPSGKVLVLERSFALTLPPFLTRLYEADFSAATDVSGLASLTGATYTKVGKTLLYSGGQTNLEGLTLGPRLAGRGWALLGIIDDGDAISVNRVVSFELSGPVIACTSDFNGDGDFGTDADIEAFYACLGGNCCAACPMDADFNADGDSGTDGDIESFFRVLGGGAC